jgi:hypothetical protein
VARKIQHGLPARSLVHRTATLDVLSKRHRTISSAGKSREPT